MKVFRKGMKGLNARHPGYYQHVFGYTGRSQTQGLVERYNGALKRLIQRHLNRRTGTDWPQHLRAAVRNYNRNPHSTIKKTSMSRRARNQKTRPFAPLAGRTPASSQIRPPPRGPAHARLSPPRSP